MEKIHSAIQKARKERDAKLANAAPAEDDLPAEAPAPNPSAIQPSPPDVQTVAAAKPAPPPAAASPVAEAWARLTPFKPDRGTMNRNRIVAFESTTNSGSYDVLRTNILRQMRAKGWKRLAVTSPTPACGKTTTCLNLGFSLGRLHDIRALVIEADLRRPSMRGTLKLKTKQMFSAFLSGEASAEENLVAVGKGLAFGTNSGPVRNSAELLASSGVTERLAELDRIYAADITIFDMPPMLVSDDTIAFLPNVDCVLLVAAAGVTTTQQVDRCERALAEQTNVLGVVLNKCQFMSPDEYYGYDNY